MDVLQLKLLAGLVRGLQARRCTMSRTTEQTR